MAGQADHRPTLAAPIAININSSALDEAVEYHVRPSPAPSPEPVRAQEGDEIEEEAPLHLEFRAPTFQHREEKISKWGMRLPGFSAEWQTQGETQCIRHKVSGVTRTFAISIPGIVDAGATADYSEFFPRVHADLEVGGQSILGHRGSHVHGAGSQSGSQSGVLPKGTDGVLFSNEVHVAPAGFRYEKSVATPGEVFLVPKKAPPYVVMGIFSGADGIPTERLVVIRDPAWLFWHIFWAILRLRGLGYFLSLKDVKAFSIYKCNWKTGVHKRVSLEQKGTNDLRLFLLAYKSLWTPDRIGKGWTSWIHKTINKNSTNPRADIEGNSLSIEVVMGWSPFRISVVIILPTLLSFVIGIWFNARDWNDLSTIQAAWGIASYVATAGGLIAALLGFISSIKDE